MEDGGKQKAKASNSRPWARRIREQTGLTQLFWRQGRTSAPEGAVFTLRLYRPEWNLRPSRALRSYE